MDEAIAAVVAAVISGAVAFTTAHFRIEGVRDQWDREQKLEKQRERDKDRIRYLDPLLVSATDLLTKIQKLINELPKKEKFWKDSFLHIKENDRSDTRQFAFECNGLHAGAMTTLYVTSVFFARASKIRSELPFIELGPREDRSLLDKLNAVRDAFSGEYNLWEELQDSIGDYVTESDGKIMNYKEFCVQVMDPSDHIWFIRLMDFYKDIHMKQKHELPRIRDALSSLIDFARAASEPQSLARDRMG